MREYGVCFITAGPITKLFAWGGEDCGGHVLRETTSRGLCGLVCPSRTSERSLGLDVDNPASAWDERNIGRGVTNRDYFPFGKRRYLGNK